MILPSLILQFVKRQVREVETATDMLGRSQESEDRLAIEPCPCWPAIRRQGFVARKPDGRTALVGHDRGSHRRRPTRARHLGMKYFISALDRADVIQRYVPILKGLADNIAASVSSLQQ